MAENGDETQNPPQITSPAQVCPLEGQLWVHSWQIQPESQRQENPLTIWTSLLSGVCTLVVLNRLHLLPLYHLL